MKDILFEYFILVAILIAILLFKSCVIEKVKLDTDLEIAKINASCLERRP